MRELAPSSWVGAPWEQSVTEAEFVSGPPRYHLAIKGWDCERARRKSHWNWKHRFVPRILKYPPEKEKLCSQFPLHSGLGGGVVLGLQIMIINMVKRNILHNKLSNTILLVICHPDWESISKIPKAGNERPLLKVMKGFEGPRIGTGYSSISLFLKKETCNPEIVENWKLSFSRGYLRIRVSNLI